MSSGSREESLFAIQKELEIAEQIQTSILPREVPRLAGVEIVARYLPMSAVAGDFYDFLTLEGRKLGILVADVTGHGVPAALIASMLKVAFAMQTAQAQNPERVLIGLNQALCGKFEEHFVTAAYLYVDLDAKIVRHAGAGHPRFCSVAVRTARHGPSNKMGSSWGCFPMQPTHRSKSQCDKTIATCFTPTDCSNPPTQREKSLTFHAASNFWNLIFVLRRQHLRTSYSVRSPNGPPALQAERRRMT